MGLITRPEESYRLWRVSVCSGSPVRGGHDRKSGRSATGKNVVNATSATNAPAAASTTTTTSVTTVNDNKITELNSSDNMHFILSCFTFC